MKNTILKISGILMLATLMFLNIQAFEKQSETGTTLSYAVSMNVAQAEGGGGGSGSNYYLTWNCAYLQYVIDAMRQNGAPCIGIRTQYNSAIQGNPSLAYCNTNLYGC